MNSLIEFLTFGALYFFAFHYTIKDANISNDDYCIKIYIYKFVSKLLHYGVY